jgi:four helix bundle protein
VQLIYRLTRQLPSEEKFVALLQIRRAAWSVHNNIAEGNAKRGRAELRRFLDTSIGSLAEIDAMLDTLGTLYDLDLSLCAELESTRRARSTRGYSPSSEGPDVVTPARLRPLPPLPLRPLRRPPATAPAPAPATSRSPASR